MKRSFIFAVVFYFAIGMASLAGPMEPPVPPGIPTMKPLDQIEPRRPITADMLPLTITDEGSSWYLAESITTTGGGIAIEANHVTIDLMGHRLAGGTGIGIQADTREGLTVRNGRIGGWTGTCIFPGFRALLENLTVKDCGGSGISANFDSMIVDTVAANNSLHGIIVKAGGMVRGCRAVNNTENGIWVEEDDSRAGGMVTGCLLKGNLRNGIRVDGYATVTDNQVLDNGDTSRAGIWVYGSKNRVEGNTVMNNNIGIEIDGSYNMITRNYVGNSVTNNFDIDYLALMNLVIVEHVWNTTPHDPWANIETP